LAYETAKKEIEEWNYGRVGEEGFAFGVFVYNESFRRGL